MRQPIADRDERVAQLLDEYLAAQGEGRAPGRDEFLAANADLRDELAAALTALEFVGRAAEELRQDVDRDSQPAPATLGDFRLLREVGRGGMGVVYEAEQISLARRVALKVLPFASVLDRRQLERFKHEAQAAARLHHTNIVPVYAVGTERGVHYYAMEFIEGRTLAAVVRELRDARPRQPSEARARSRRPSPRGKATEQSSSAEARTLAPDSSTETPEYCRAVAQIGVQAAEALDHAHGQGVVHRDIKPANLMINAEGRISITDFGLATSRANPQLTLTGAIVGTLGYMSPEQALGKRGQVDHRADIYSLGVTLLELLTLDPAFGGDDPREVIHDIATRAPTPPRKLNPAVPTALENILLKATAKEPSARYETAQEMADDLRRFLAHEPVRARREPILDRLTRSARRHRAGVAAAACVLVVAVVALAVDSIRGAAALRRIQDALDESTRRAEEAKRSRARAEANLAKARDAVDRMLTRLGASRLAGIPGLQPLRRELLQDAVGMYDELLASAGDDPAVRLDAAGALVLLSRVHTNFGEPKAAVPLADRACAMLRELATEDGPWHPALHRLAEAEEARALGLAKSGSPAEGIAAAAHADVLAERGARERPDVPHMQWCLAGILRTYGTALADVRRFDEAEPQLRKAVEICDAALARDAGSRDAHEQTALTSFALAELQLQMGRWADAERSYRAVLTQSEVCADAPGDSAIFATRATAREQVADLVLSDGKFGEALPLLEAAVAARTRQVADFPSNPQFAAKAARAAGVLSVALFRAGRTDAATARLAESRARFDGVFAGPKEAHEVRLSAAADLMDVAARLAEAGRTAESQSACRRSIDAAREVVRDAPRAAWRFQLATLLVHGHQLLRSDLSPQEKFDISKEARDEAQRAADSPDALPEYRDLLATALARYGRESFSIDAAGADAALEKSVAILNERISRTPGVPALEEGLTEALSYWALACLWNGDLDRGEPLVRKVEARGHQVAEILAKLAELELVSGRFPRANEDARKAIDAAEADLARCAEDVAAQRNLARACELRRNAVMMSGGRIAEALPLSEKEVRASGEILRLAPSADARVRLGLARHAHSQVLANLGRRADAERELRDLLAWAGGLPPEESAHASLLRSLAWSQLGDMLGDDPGRVRDALDAYRRALEAVANRGDTTYRLILLLAEGPDPALRDARSAVDVARAALPCVPVERETVAPLTPEPFQLQPQIVWNLLGLALVSDARWEEGLAAFAKARELGYEEDGTDWIYEAIACARLGRDKESRTYAARADEWFEAHPGVAEIERFVRRRAEAAAALRPGTPR